MRSQANRTISRRNTLRDVVVLPVNSVAYSITAEHVDVEHHLPALQGLKPVQGHHGAAHIGKVKGVVAPEHVDGNDRA